MSPLLRRELTPPAQLPRIRTCSSQINLYEGKIAVRETERGGGTELSGNLESSNQRRAEREVPCSVS